MRDIPDLPVPLLPWGDAPAGAAELADDEVHLWCAPTVLPEPVLARLRGHLTPEEAARIERFRQPADRQRQLIARGLLREILSRVLMMPPAAIPFRTGPYGKPLLGAGTPEPSLHFNLSHSGGWVVIAVSRGAELGIDIEAARDDRPIAGIADRLFGPDELAWYRGPDVAPLDIFYRVWTVREAYLKAIGTGLAGAAGRDILAPGGVLADPGWSAWRLAAVGPYGVVVVPRGTWRFSAWRL